MADILEQSGGVQRPPLQSAVNPAEKKQYVYDRFADVVPAGWNKYSDGGGVSGSAAVNGGGGSNTGAVGVGVGTGSSQGAAPVKRANAFLSVGGKGKTIGQRMATSEKNNAASNDAFLQSVASDNLDRHDRSATDAAFGRGELVSPSRKPYEWQSNVYSFRDGQEKSGVNAWGGDSSKSGDPAFAGKMKKADNSFAAFRSGMYDEDKIRRQSDTRSKVYALGDALRNIGYLGLVADRDASKVKFGTSPAAEERDSYELGRKSRDAYAYKMYTDKIAQDAAQAERERKAIQAQSGLEKDRSTIAYNEVRTKELMQRMGINADKAPWELKEQIGKAYSAAANGDKATAEAYIKQIEAQHADVSAKLEEQLLGEKVKTEKARQGQIASQISLNAVRAENIRTDTKNKLRELSGASNPVTGKALGTFGTKGKNVTKEQKTQIVRTLRDEGYVTNDVWDRYTGNGDAEKKTVDEDDIIAALLNTCPTNKMGRAVEILESNGYKSLEDRFTLHGNK